MTRGKKFFVDDLVQVLSFMEIGNLEENLTLTAGFFIQEKSNKQTNLKGDIITKHASKKEWERDR